MPEEKHIIRKAIVEVHLPKADAAFDKQNKALVYFKEKILPMIERIVDRLAADGETIRIGKLELDFYSFNAADTTDGALRKFEAQVEEKLLRLIAAEKQDDPSGESPVVKKIPREQSEEELFFYLLKAGTLPWWTKTEATVSLEQLAQKLVKQSSGSFKQKLMQLLNIPQVRRRIAYGLSAATTEKIMALVLSAMPQLLNDISVFSDTFKNSIDDSSFFQELYEYALLPPTAASISLRRFIAVFITAKNDLRLAEKIYTALNRLEKNAASAGHSSALSETARVIKNALADTDVHFGGKIKKMFVLPDVKLFFDGEKKQEPVVEKPASENPVFIIDAEPAEDYFIKNAGVVIITPYLPVLFKELGLLDDKGFVSDEAKERAVYLLQHLSTGQTADFEEHEMVFSKVICGMEINQPLLHSFIISEKEQEECSGLLQAVAANWSALKGTSGEGMRDAFFTREGILEQQTNGWNLKIEKTTIDILLDKLPWGISILQMPWSSEMIFVTW